MLLQAMETAWQGIVTGKIFMHGKVFMHGKIFMQVRQEGMHVVLYVKNGAGVLEPQNFLDRI